MMLALGHLSSIVVHIEQRTWVEPRAAMMDPRRDAIELSRRRTGMGAGVPGFVEPALGTGGDAEAVHLVRPDRRAVELGGRHGAVIVGERLALGAGIHPDVGRGVEVGARVAAFGFAIVQVVLERVDTGLADVRIVLEIPAAVEVGRAGERRTAPVVVPGRQEPLDHSVVACCRDGRSDDAHERGMIPATIT